ncbi:lymphocyte antigen 6 complex locus protein G6d [Ctenopharyngodon idella]|uniref:lymphocyte antigen 6 complex locus protein G6d n=1 Tax=Ctenopharyngodon idella TaxID=7959 RepID=UPI00222E1FC4|nr:lymphocyte antigen 6 complex locus protein G6d [Ctenopharyngodon idella]
MNKIIFGFFAVFLYFAVGQSLECYDCKLGLGSLCYTTKKTCDAGQQCFSGLGTAVGFVDIKMKGCLEVSKCNKTEQETLFSNSSAKIYQITKTCCSTDLCNSALGHFSAVSMAFTTITSVFMVKFLI